MQDTVFEQNPEPLNFTNHGISYIHITIHPENSIKLPLKFCLKLFIQIHIYLLLNITPDTIMKIYIDYLQMIIYLFLV